MSVATLAVCALLASELSARITVDTLKPGITISPDLYGIFFEEINCAGDGGLYAELIRNRGFEDSDKPDHWEILKKGDAKCSVSVEVRDDAGKEGRQLRLDFTEGKAGQFGIANEGYWGIPIRTGQQYELSVKFRGTAGLEAAIEGRSGHQYAQCRLEVHDSGWNVVKAKLVATGTDTQARLVLRPSRLGTVWIQNVSLFPAATYKARVNGMRSDLAQMLADLRPSFMRFPGGCWVEGDTMATSQRWKRTVGELSARRTQQNLWGYMSTNGLGYHEYLELCEDLGASPLFVINCGMSHHEVVPMGKMDEFVQDALDAIEYANGPVTSTWGALRAANGHPSPFGLKYLEIGNENGGEPYRERFPLIARAVKAKYPEIQIIANVWGGYPKGPFTEIIDEHYYSSPDFFFQNSGRYDHYDRSGPKVYVGEYAVTEGCGNGNLIAALGEAAFMTGMERNSDLVKMASYAPLFANVNFKKWNPDLINFDGARTFGTPSYYVQQMFSRNRGDRVLPTVVDVTGIPVATFRSGGIGIGTWGTQSQFKDIKAVTIGGRTLFESTTGQELAPTKGTWKVVDGTLIQTSNDEGTNARAGSADWTNYVLTLKARKTGGREGFLVSFGAPDSRNWIWWNIGGWGNTQHALERSVDGGKSRIGREVLGSVEVGRWYDVKVVFESTRIRCYLDGKLIHDVSCPQTRPLHLVASEVDKTGAILLKVVNGGAESINSAIDFNGVAGPFRGRATTLTSARPLDENTLEQPLKVAPKESRFEGAFPRLSYTFPAYSVTVLHLAKRNHDH